MPLIIEGIESSEDLLEVIAECDLLVELARNDQLSQKQFQEVLATLGAPSIEIGRRLWLEQKKALVTAFNKAPAERPNPLRLLNLP